MNDNRIITTQHGTFLFQIVSNALHSFSCSGHILDYLPNNSGQFDDCIVLPDGNWSVVGDINSNPINVVDKYDTMLGVYYKDYSIDRTRKIGRGVFSIIIHNERPKHSTSLRSIEDSMASVINYDKNNQTVLILKRHE